MITASMLRPNLDSPASARSSNRSLWDVSCSLISERKRPLIDRRELQPRLSIYHQVAAADTQINTHLGLEVGSVYGVSARFIQLLSTTSPPQTH